MSTKKQKKQVIINAILSISRVFVVGISSFILYRVVINSLGIEKLGVWSLVLSTTSITRISDLGFSSSVVKFVAKYRALGKKQRASDFIQTALISIFFISGLIIILLFVLLQEILPLIVDEKEIHLTISLLPYGMLSLFVTLLAGVFQSGLDGCQRIDIRELIQIGSSIIYLVLSLLLIQKYKLFGLAYASIIQSLVIFIFSWIFLYSFIEEFPLFPRKWKKDVFIEMFSYGINFQIVSVVRMLYEPTTTALMSNFGGLAIVGYYQMAKKLIRQIRSFIVSANQTLVPFLADIKERSPEIVQSYYKRSYSLVFYVSVPVYFSIIAMSPDISKLWVGSYEPIFIRFSIILSISWFLNTLNVPAYFANLGLGKLKWNTIAHLVIALLNVVFGLVFGSLFGGEGVVIAWGFSLVIGSLILIIGYHKQNKISLKTMFPNESSALFIICSTVSFFLFFLNSKISISNYDLINLIIIFILFSLLSFAPLWFHPMRRKIFKTIYSLYQ